TRLFHLVLPRRCVHLSLIHTLTANLYTLSLHDALPISASRQWGNIKRARECALFDINAVNAVTVATIAMLGRINDGSPIHKRLRSEEHTSELQSRENLVCRLLLEKKNKPDESANERPHD